MEMPSVLYINSMLDWQAAPIGVEAAHGPSRLLARLENHIVEKPT